MDHTINPMAAGGAVDDGYGPDVAGDAQAVLSPDEIFAEVDADSSGAITFREFAQW
jgi:Ca2+-binding EF-hand superfamily protein